MARGLVAVVLVLTAIPAYLTLAPSWRPLGVRLVCAALVAAGCVRLIRWVRRSVADDPPSALEAARLRAPAPALDDRFLRLRDEIVFSRRSRRYFDTVLWPRLQKLAGADLPRPAERGGIRRDGPPASTLERLISEVERRG